MISTTHLSKILPLGPRKRFKTNGAIVGGRKWSEQVDIFQFLLKLLDQCVEPLADVFWRQLFRLASLRLLAFLAHEFGKWYGVCVCDGSWRNTLLVGVDTLGESRVDDGVASDVTALQCNGYSRGCCTERIAQILDYDLSSG